MSSWSKLRKFTFVEIDLCKKCYRAIFVHASDEMDARNQLKVSWAVD